MNLSQLERIGLVKAIGVRALAVHQAVYERTDGRIGHRILGAPSLLLRTVGAKTGKPRTNGLIYGSDGDRYLVVPSNGGADRAPGWYHNLKAQPECEAQVGTRRIPVRARTIGPDDPGFDRAWDIVNKINRDRYRAYQKATKRTIPVVELTPR